MNRDIWFQRLPGAMVIAEERVILDRLLKSMRGNALLQIGGPIDQQLTACACTPRVYYVDSAYRARHAKLVIQADTNALPIDTDAVDIVLITHALECSDSPLALLQEAHRVLKPNGQLIVLGFNQWSLWQLWKLWSHKRRFPWCGRFYSTGWLKRALSALDFQIDVQQTLCFRPPLHDQWWLKKLLFLEAVGQTVASNCGGVYVVAATKQVVGMTPLMLHNPRWSVETFT